LNYTLSGFKRVRKKDKGLLSKVN